MSATTRRRARIRTQQQQQPQPDGPLQLAINQLTDAIHALTHPQPQNHNGALTWLDARYTQLRQSIATASISGHRRNTPSSLIPAQIDCLKLAIHIDTRTTRLTGIPDHHTTPARLQHSLTQNWRPQDSTHLQTMATEIRSWCKAVDDLFAPKPIYLPDACPHCGHTHAYRIGDDGERIRTPALAVTAERGAWCQQCHDQFHPLFLGRLLGYRTEGIGA